MVAARLRSYGLQQVFDLVGRVSAVLYHAPVNPKEQQRLCTALLEDRGSLIWQRAVGIAGYAASDDEASFILFEETSLSAVLKMACLSLPTDGPPGQGGLRQFGEALLMANDLVDQTPLTPTGEDPETEEGRRAWVYYVFVVGLAQAHPNELNSLTRTFDLFLTDRPHLRNDPAYIDLPRLIEEATHVGPQPLWAVLFAFVSHFFAINGENAHEAHAVIGRSTYFAEALTFSESEAEAFFTLVAGTIADLQAQMKRLYSPSAIRPFHILPLMGRPLASAGDAVFCPLLRHLVGKMTDGIYHVLLNALPADSPSRDRFPVYVGSVFEDYVDQMMKRLVEKEKSRLAPRHRLLKYVDASTLADAARPSRGPATRSCDGLLVYDGMVVLLETKAKFFTVDMRCGDDQTGFFDRLDEMVLRAARQISATTDLILSGGLAGLGIDSATVTQLQPVVIVLQHFPMQPIIYNYLRQRVEQEGLLSQSGVLPFQCLDASDLELLETLAEAGRPIRDLMELKVNDPWGRQQSLTNFMAARPDLAPSQTVRNPYLEKVWHGLTAGMDEYLEAHRRPSGSSP